MHLWLVALRFDVGVLGEARRTPTGGVEVPAAITRVGIFPYMGPDGKIIRELRPPEEVFAQESLASLRNATVTDRHPPEMINTLNHRTFARGHVSSEATHDQERVHADLAINDGDLIEKIEKGDAREISAGYVCQHEDAPGLWQGQPYDRVQRNIRYNHVAVGPVGWARGGRELALRLDDAAALVEESRGTKPRTTNGENPVKKIPKATVDLGKRVLRLDDLDFPLRSDDERALAKNAINASMRRAREELRFDSPEAQAMASEILSSVETLQSQLVSLIDALGSATPAVDTGAAPAAPAKDAGAAPAAPAVATEEEKKDAMDKAVKEMIGLIERCRALHPEIKYDGLSALELMKRAIAHVDPSIKMDGADWQDPKFVSGVFAAMKPRTAAHGKARIALGEPGAPREDGEDDLEKKKREAREARANAWRGAPAKS